MSSILEALKKLEADKNAQHMAIQEPEPVYTSDQMAQSLLGNYADSTPSGGRQSPVLLVLGGALFTVRMDATLPPPHVGQAVRLRASPSQLHWFDADTGLRVGD